MNKLLERMIKNMELLMVFLKKIELVDDVMHHLADAGIRGGTIVEGTGMAKCLVDMENLPMFGMLRYLLSDEDKIKCKVLLFAIDIKQSLSITIFFSSLITSSNCILFMYLILTHFIFLSHTRNYF